MTNGANAPTNLLMKTYPNSASAKFFKPSRTTLPFMVLAHSRDTLPRRG